MFILGIKYGYDKDNDPHLKFVLYYLAWNLINILRGCFIAENYWDWRGFIINTMALLIPISAYVATNKSALQAILRTFIRFGLPMFILVAFLIPPGAYGFYLVPIGFFIFFIPLLDFKWKLIIIFFTFIVLIADLGARSNVIKFGIPVMFLAIFWLRRLISNKLLEAFRMIFLIVPFVLFYLGVTGIFNVFNIGEYVKGNFVEVKKNDKGEIEEEDLTVDTRTFLYEEVLQTAAKYNVWWFGRSPAKGNETEAFANLAEISGKAERQANEVAILNVFMWTGIVGLVLYFLVFYIASYLAIHNSNNIYSKMMGLFVAFRWTYAWVEDINNFTLNYFFIWIIIGFCLSNSFRKMSDFEMKIWVRGIFARPKRLSKRIKHQAQATL